MKADSEKKEKKMLPKRWVENLRKDITIRGLMMTMLKTGPTEERRNRALDWATCQGRRRLILEMESQGR